MKLSGKLLPGLGSIPSRGRWDGKMTMVRPRAIFIVPVPTIPYVRKLYIKYMEAS